MKSEEKWEVLEEETYEAIHLFKIKRSLRRNPRTSSVLDFFLVEGLDWVTVIPVTSDGRFVLIRQYRQGAEEYTFEFPGGCVEPQKKPEEAAANELIEETGYTGNLKFLGTIRPNPAMFTNRCHVFLAPSVKLNSLQKLDDGEDISVELVDKGEFEKRIGTGDVSHAIVLAAYSLFLLKEQELKA